MSSKGIDNSIAKAAAAPARKQKKSRAGKIIGACVACFFIALLFALSINSIVALAVDDYKLTAKNSVLNLFLSFTQSGIGLFAMIACIMLIIAVWVLTRYILYLTDKRKLLNAALTKSQEALSRVSLRYDNVHEITAVLDVLGMLTDKPKTKKEQAEIAARINAFIKAENIALPHTPETAAILDSLPAPDTPSSLAAALSAGATLRQAEDGQTLVLTTISGGKNILLTPVQTADGIILCRQGARIKSDLAPNLEEIGYTSMPASPEFFEGLPLEKNVIYPELPEPKTFGPEMLSGSAEVSNGHVENTGVLSAPTPTAKAGYAALGGGTSVALLDSSEHAETAEIPAPKTEEPQSPTERLNVVASAKPAPSRKKSAATPKKELTPEEIAAKKEKAKQAAAKRKKEREDFLASLSTEERESYLAEQALKKSRQATARKQKKLETDSKVSKNTDED